MRNQLPRDEEGYVDLDALPDEDIDAGIDLFPDPPPVPDTVWETIVTTAPYIDPHDHQVDTHALTGGLADLTDPTRDLENDAVTCAAPLETLTDEDDAPARNDSDRWADDHADYPGGAQPHGDSEDVLPGH
jgi:hypothetical protein